MAPNWYTNSLRKKPLWNCRGSDNAPKHRAGYLLPEEHGLKVFKDRTMRKIFGPKKEKSNRRLEKAA
jgi:hypothetical protein